jgi:lipopolysaccharide assembly outer membrane protein LptD (OstA)
VKRAGALGLVALLTACAHAAPAPTASPAGAPPAGPTPLPLHVVSSGNGSVTTLTEMKHGRRLYTIRAATFVADSTAGQSAAGNGTFDQPQITFVDRLGGSTVANAPKAVLTGADKSVIMTGGVRARSQDGNVLHCDRLRYDGKTERVHGDGNVRMETPSGLVLVGDVLDGDARLANVVVRKTR